MVTFYEDDRSSFLLAPVLLEEEGEKHEEATVMHNPPDVNVALHMKARGRYTCRNPVNVNVTLHVKAKGRYQCSNPTCQCCPTYEN